MPKRLLAASVLLSTLLVTVAVSHSAPAAKSAPGTLTIVYKDGHRQAINLSEIDRLEYPAGTLAAADMGEAKTHIPPRGRYIGKWEVGDGVGNTFTITLSESGSAYRSLGSVHGRWVYGNGDALITWEDGAQDAIRKVGAHYQKFAYSAGKLFTDQPDNVTDARNTSPKPI